MKLVGLIGHAGSGKNTFAEEFHFHSYREYSFAGPLKAACAELFGIPLGSFYSRKDKELPDPFWNKSPREILQYTGTEVVRESLGEDFWVRRMEYNLLQEAIEAEATGARELRVIITDCRFKNEVDFILSKGGSIIHLTRPDHSGNVGILGHASEQFVSQFPSLYPDVPPFYFVENNGTLDDLRIKAQVLAAQI